MSKAKLTRELVVYIIVGILTTVVGMGSYALFINATGLSVFWANAFSWILAAIFAFVTNKIWVFQSKTRDKMSIIKEASAFFAARIFTGVFEIVFVPLFEKWSFDKPFFSLLKAIGINAQIFYTDGIYSKIIVSVLVVLMNYFFSKFFVFRNKNDLQL